MGRNRAASARPWPVVAQDVRKKSAGGFPPGIGDGGRTDRPLGHEIVGGQRGVTRSSHGRGAKSPSPFPWGVRIEGPEPHTWTQTRRDRQSTAAGVKTHYGRQPVGTATATFAELAQSLQDQGHDPQTVVHFVNRLLRSSRLVPGALTTRRNVK